MSSLLSMVRILEARGFFLREPPPRTPFVWPFHVITTNKPTPRMTNKYHQLMKQPPQYNTTMLEMSQTTIITPDENDVDDFLDLSAFAAGATFSLSAWSTTSAPCHAFEPQDEQDNQCHATSSIPSSWRRPPYESSDSSSSVVSSDECATRRVRFSAAISEVRIYERPTAEDWSSLYYSCHELQKIVDEYRQEEEEWQAECARLEEGAKSPSDSSITSTLCMEQHQCVVKQQITEIQHKMSTALLIVAEPAVVTCSEGCSS